MTRRLFDPAFVDLVAPAMVMTAKRGVGGQHHDDPAARLAVVVVAAGDPLHWHAEARALLDEARAALAEQRPMQWDIVAAAVGGPPWPAPADLRPAWQSRKDAGDGVAE